jgi:AAA domain
MSATRVPPDLSYLHNFGVPERSKALCLPAGQGSQLRMLKANLVKSLQLLALSRLGPFGLQPA